MLPDKIALLRRRFGWTQEDLAAQLEVSRQSVSKWESGASQPELDKVLAMSRLFGVSTDYLLKDEMEPETALAVEPSTALAAEAEPLYPVLKVSMEESVAFLDMRNINSGRIALGVMLCILSPVLLILLNGLAEGVLLPLSEGQASGLGLIVLFLLVGGAVALFVTSSLRSHAYECFEEEMIETAYGIDGMVRERKERFRRIYLPQLTIGIVLCVVSALPIFTALFLFGENPATDVPFIIAVAILLILVAIGVFMIVRVSIIWGGFQVLLEEGDYSREHKLENKKEEHLSAIYWCTVIAIYLGYSFITNNWSRSWIVWPIAGVFYGAVSAVARALRSRG